MSKTSSNVWKKDNLQDPIISENSLTVLKNRYLAKDETGRIIEDPKDCFMRVAWAVAQAEETEEAKIYWATEFYNLMATGKFMPNSPTIMNAGRRLGMLSACFVLPVEDDLKGIFESIEATALVQRAGGGTGFNFSKLRPNGSIVGSSGGTTAGPLSFINVFSQATSAIQQGAFRRGANMGILDCDHPDIIDFIKAKSDLKRWQNYNVSVAITDRFMAKVKDDRNFQHRVRHKKWGKGALWVNDQGHVKAVLDGQYEGEGYDVWTYKDTWNLICLRAWETGEPGLFFVDRANKNNPVPHLGKITATNPCGEQNLHDNDSCNLGSINLSKFINKTSSSHVAFNNLELEETVAVATRFLDNVITVNNYPLPQIEEQSKLTRRIGLGVMGWADMLFALGIPYGSPESLSLAKNIMACISNKAERVSRDLGKEKGSYTANKSSGPMRNSYRTTVAPTGTISIIADCSGGIEPIFALAFKREVMPDSDGKFVIMTEFNPYFKEALEKLSEIDAKASKDLEELAEKTGSIASYSSLDLNIYASEEVERMKQVFVTSHDIPWASHIDMQGAWQKYVDSCISKTINLSRDSNPDSISDTYTYAYDQGCNGITVYRDGSRENKEGMKQPMKVAHSEQPKVKEKPKKSPETQDVLPAHRLRVSTPFGNLHVMITVDPETDEELEIFAQLGKSGEAVAADLEGMCRMASLYLREGGSIHSVYDQWSDIGSRHMLPTADGKISSLPDALAKGLKKYLSSKLALQENSSKVNETEIYRMECPSCGKKGLQLQEGCKVCVNCGYSAC
jgi:ribonucleoside-diphosphate reductase alpha chain